MRELDISLGIGIGDLQSAARREVRSLLKAAKGNPDRAVILGLKKLVEMQIITEEERGTLTKMFEIGFSAEKGKTPANDAYLKCRTLADEMLATGKQTSPALALALAETNSYVAVDEKGGTQTVVYKKQSWESRLAVAGAGIGGVIGGGGGAVIGGIIGGVVGAIVDECKD